MTAMQFSGSTNHYASISSSLTMNVNRNFAPCFGTQAASIHDLQTRYHKYPAQAFRRLHAPIPRNKRETHANLAHLPLELLDEILSLLHGSSAVAFKLSCRSLLCTNPSLPQILMRPEFPQQDAYLTRVYLENLTLWHRIEPGFARLWPLLSCSACKTKHLEKDFAWEERWTLGQSRKCWATCGIKFLGLEVRSQRSDGVLWLGNESGHRSMYMQHTAPGKDLKTKRQHRVKRSNKRDGMKGVKVTGWVGSHLSMKIPVAAKTAAAKPMYILQRVPMHAEPQRSPFTKQGVLPRLPVYLVPPMPPSVAQVTAQGPIPSAAHLVNQALAQRPSQLRGQRPCARVRRRGFVARLQPPRSQPEEPASRASPGVMEMRDILKPKSPSAFGKRPRIPSRSLGSGENE